MILWEVLAAGAAGNALVPEEENGPLHDVQHFLLGGKYLVHGVAVGHALTPAAAQVDPVAVRKFLGHTKGTLALAAATVVAGLGIIVQFFT